MKDQNDEYFKAVGKIVHYPVDRIAGDKRVLIDYMLTMKKYREALKKIKGDSK